MQIAATSLSVSVFDQWFTETYVIFGASTTMTLCVLFPFLDPHETMYDDSVDQSLCDDICHRPFNDTKQGCCDGHDARCTCSLVGGHHDCVCGPGTFGRNGFWFQCQCT